MWGRQEMKKVTLLNDTTVYVASHAIPMLMDPVCPVQ